jgi:pimeloyl-ACP methyl ester carboxylesterase
LVAHDWGGSIAWHVAHCYDFVDQLICLNMPHPSAFAAALKTTPAQQAKSLYMLYFQLPLLPDRQLAARGGEPVAGLIANDLVTTPATAADKVLLFVVFDFVC